MSTNKAPKAGPNGSRMAPRRSDEGKGLVKLKDPKLIRHLDELVATGHFGSSRREVAESILRAAIRDQYIDWLKVSAGDER